MKTHLRIFFLFLMLVVSSDLLLAQTLNLQSIPSDKIQVGFNFNKPFYAGTGKWSALSGSYELNLNIPVSSKINVIGDIPFQNTSYEVNSGFINYSYKEAGIGNIFIGIQIKPNQTNGGKSYFTAGVFLPTADEQASLSGLFVNYYHIQKYFPNSLGLYFNYADHKMFNGGFSYVLEIGPNIIIPTEEGFAETEMFFHYGVNAG